MFRKTIVTALIAMVGAGTILATFSLDAPGREITTARHVVGEQTGPKRNLRFKVPRPVNLRTAEIERIQPVAMG